MTVTLNVDLLLQFLATYLPKPVMIAVLIVLFLGFPCRLTIVPRHRPKRKHGKSRLEIEYQAATERSVATSADGRRCKRRRSARNIRVSLGPSSDAA